MLSPPASIARILKARVFSWYDGAIGWKQPPPPMGASGPYKPFIVTGPPRSGTSLMNSLLSRRNNIAIVNEPFEVMPRLLLTGRGERKLRGYLHRTARRAINKGQVINKVDPDHPDRPTSDTFNKGAQWRAIPIRIDRHQPLCVAVKATMPFMDCLGALCADWPELRAIVMIREPGATLRSWKQTFGWQPGLDRPGAGFQFRLYSKVDRAGDSLQLRARLWSALVEETLRVRKKYPDQILIVRYESLLADPATVLARVFAHIGSANPDEPVDTTDVRPQNRPKYVGFTDEEAATIEHECQEAMKALEGL